MVRKVTNGHWAGIKGRLAAWAKSPPGLAYGILAVLAGSAAIVNSLSLAHGAPSYTVEPWISEGTSLAATLVLGPAVLFCAGKLIAMRRPAWLLLGAHVLLTVPFSIAHMGLMAAFRHLAYAGLGRSYSYDFPFWYEWRKDAFLYLATLVLLSLSKQVFRAPPARPSAPPLLRVDDGKRCVVISPNELEWIEAVGNYVELHGSFGTVLHRATLSSLQANLETVGFLRVHRSRLVHLAKVREISRGAGGGVRIRMASGKIIEGSRRHRSKLIDSFRTLDTDFGGRSPAPA